MMQFDQSEQNQNKLTSNRQSFLLRLWRENDYSPWRITIQSSTTSDRQTFTDLPSLVTYLETVMAETEE